MNDITIVIPNRGGESVDVVINSFKNTYKDLEPSIILINQEDGRPFMKGQLYNIAFKYVDTEYMLLIDNDIYNLNRLDLINIYKKFNNPFLGFGYVSQIALRYNNTFKEIDKALRPEGFGAFAFMKYVDFSNSGGFSNLCFLWGCEDAIFNLKLHGFNRLEDNVIGHISHSRRNFLAKSMKNNRQLLDLYKNKEIEYFKDGYEQTIYDLVYDEYIDGVRHIGVKNIHVPEDYKYMDLYEANLEDAENDLKDMNEYDKGVSVCITAYHADDTIKETLDSVISQTWFRKNKNWEILVGVDGCEDTLEYLKTIMNNYKNLRVFMMDSNMGTYVTTNTLFKIAKYENILRFDADDIMCADMVESFMEGADKYDFQRCKYVFMGTGVKTTWCSFGQQFVKKSIFEQFGGYRDWKCASDYEFALRIKPFVNCKELNKHLFYYRVSTTSLTKAPETSMQSEYREELHKQIHSAVYNTPEEAKIECVTNTYTEVFSDVYDYYSGSYMMMTDQIFSDMPEKKHAKTVRRANSGLYSNASAERARNAAALYESSLPKKKVKKIQATSVKYINTPPTKQLYVL